MAVEIQNGAAAWDNGVASPQKHWTLSGLTLSWFQFWAFCLTMRPYSRVQSRVIHYNHSAEANQCPLTDEWKSSVVHPCMEYYSVFKRKEILLLLCG